MIRQPEHERQQRLALKNLDQVALHALQHDFDCSLFESRAILDMMHHTFEQTWHRPTQLQPGQMLVLAIAASEPPGKPLVDCAFKPIVITLHSPADDQQRRQLKGRRLIAEIRRTQLARIAAEAVAQDAYLTVEDVANHILNCGERTLVRDVQVLRTQGQSVPLRGQQADIGRTVSHKVQTIQLALQRHPSSEIARRLHHDLRSVERYLTDFAAVAQLLAQAWDLETIAFVRRVSLALVREYQTLYQQKHTPAERTALADLLRTWAPAVEKKAQKPNPEGV